MSAASLKVTSTARPGSRLAVEVAIPAERSQASYEAAISQLSRSVNLPGFRKGKVPRSVLIQQLGGLRIRATALENLVDAIWRDTIKQETIEALGQPEVDGGYEALLESFEPGKPLSVTFESDVAPTPTLKATKGLKAEAESVSFDAAKVDEMLEQSRRQLATVVPVEGRKAAEGDIAVVGFKGTYSDDGSEIEGGSSESMDVDLEHGRMIPGFIEGVVGMAIGDSKTVACNFPEDYPKEDARGRKASFEIELKDLKTRELPDLDDDFAKQASEQETLAELRTDLEKRLKDDAERRTTSNRRDALLAALVEQLEVELPETLVQQEVRNLVEQTAAQFSQQGMDVKSLFTPELVRNLMETSRPEAEERLRRSLALSALAEAESLKIEDPEIDAKVKEVKAELSGERDIDPNRLRQAVIEDLLQEKLLGWLEENSTVSEKAPDKDKPKAADA
ncbi:MAG: trigger factor [Cyanobium sp. MED195]|uniref:trigger factor n=1 Tax=Synechococcus sp. (strain WH8020) TaxID=32052 RepID=UPI000652753E|nr:trigger factor [Synechococcus sp. WH 8020]AKN61636.1 trigger factor [Synechococcus sp. WH 8020]MAK15908.1 trigger factor [Cyanobium sp. MED195]